MQQHDPQPAVSDLDADAEARRLAALASYEIEGTGREQAYDDVVALACNVCDVPMAAVTFVGSDRQWYKAREGFEFQETPRGYSICSRMMLSDAAVVEIPDVREDPRFAAAAELSQGQLVFYASTPIRSRDGQPLGTVCIMDNQPRHLTDKQRDALRLLGTHVTHLLDMRRSDLESQRAAARHAANAQELQQAQIHLRERNDAIQREASLDSLTRVFNRSVLQSLLEDPAAVHDTLGEHYAVVLIDADRFKEVNDQRGHLVGDRVLIGLAEAIHSAVRANDLAVRYGGDEFVVLLSGANLDTATHVAERIRKHFLQSYVIRQFGVTLSMGVAERAQGELLPTVMKRADRALYRAKEAGRDRVEADTDC